MSHDFRFGRPVDEPESRSGAPHQVVRSAEQVELELPIAGPATRILAYAIDYVVIALIQIVLLLLVFFAGVLNTSLSEFLDGVGDRAADLASEDASEVGGVMVMFVAVFVLFQLVAEWGYFVVSEMATGGRSLGKAIIGLRVVRDGGGALTLRESLARNLMRFADMLPTSYLVGLVAMIASPEGKRLGDLVAGTVVVRLDDAPVAAPVVTRGDADPAEFRLDRSQLERIGTAERTLIRQTLRRVDELPADRGEEALDRACRALCARLSIDPVPGPRQRAFLEALYDRTHSPHR